MAFSSVPNDSEEGRGFLQQRLALFGKSVFFLFLGIGAVVATVLTLGEARIWSHMRGLPYHVVAVLGVGVLWLVCRRGTRSIRTLSLLDAGITILAGVGFALMVFIAPTEMLPGVPATLAVTHLLAAHAIIVPSDWRRTLWISGLAALPVAASVGVAGIGGGPGGQELPMVANWRILLPAWCVLAVVLATFTSHVLYRLRRRVLEARTLGQYTLEEKIGEGGMGVVYRARHAMLRRSTVVKLLPQEKAGQANLARFEREVQLTSQLSSPNTVAIYDYGRTPDGIFYYAMEYLDGVDLEKLVAEAGTLPASRVIHVLAQVCQALAEAHDAGLIHRDIKPSNVMLCRLGGLVDVVKVLDFGLVKDLGGSSDDVKLTHADTVLGTPLYVSPESIRAPETVDARSDLYAVGAVGYFLLTGRAVFEGRTVAEVCGQHLYATPVPPSRRADGVPADVEGVLLGCLAKTQDERPEHARALRAALLGCADAGGWSDAAAAAWWRGRGPAASASPGAEPRVVSPALAATVTDEPRA